MSSNELLRATVIRVAVIERIVCGVAGYRAECLGCDWKGKPRAREDSAVRDARLHTKHKGEA